MAPLGWKLAGVKGGGGSVQLGHGQSFLAKEVALAVIVGLAGPNKGFDTIHDAHNLKTAMRRRSHHGSEAVPLGALGGLRLCTAGRQKPEQFGGLVLELL